MFQNRFKIRLSTDFYIVYGLLMLAFTLFFGFVEVKYKLVIPFFVIL